MSSSNLAVLTSSHRIIASKKRARKNEIKEVVFDETARRDFLTGFHKRKLQKKEAARKKAQDKEKQERLDARREKRQMLAEKAAKNAADVEKAYGGTVPDEDSEDESGGIDANDDEREEEYEDEEQLATVTVVEDFDPEELLHGPDTTQHRPDDGDEADRVEDMAIGAESVKSASKQKSTPMQAKTRAKVAKKAKEVKYETNTARRREREKQHKRKLEKADRAGGKGSRRKGSGRGKR